MPWGFAKGNHPFAQTAEQAWQNLSCCALKKQLLSIKGYILTPCSLVKYHRTVSQLAKPSGQPSGFPPIQLPIPPSLLPLEWPQNPFFTLAPLLNTQTGLALMSLHRITFSHAPIGNDLSPHVMAPFALLPFPYLC